MPTYALAGMAITTAVALPELAEVASTEGAWSFELTPNLPTGTFDLRHEAVTVDGRVWLEIRRDDTRYVLRFPELAHFVITPERRCVSCVADEGVGETTLRHLLLDQVVPHILALDGSLVLHASAVATRRGAVAFVGPSGFGKSSLAAGFAVQGFALLADDFVLLAEGDDGFLATPSYPGLRLWPDSVAALAADGSDGAPVSDQNDKQRLVLGAEPTAFESTPLLAIVILGDEPEDDQTDVVLRTMSAREGLMAVFEQAFRMERFGRERQRAEFDRFARLAESTVLLAVDYQRDYEKLPAVCAAILDALDLSGTVSG